MKIGFVIADENEFYPFLDFARENSAKEYKKRNRDYIEFSYAGKDIVAVKAGIGYLSEDRKRFGIVVQKTVAENTTMATMEQFMNGLFINEKKEKEVAEKYVEALATKTPNVEQLVVNLSGGNQQKVVIAKWLTRDCEILIFDEPTRGIDVGAKNEIYKLMNKLAAEGKSIIMISSEMTEILRMSDRVIVMCEGKKTGEIDISEATQENIMNLATREIN